MIHHYESAVSYLVSNGLSECEHPQHNQMLITEESRDSKAAKHILRK